VERYACSIVGSAHAARYPNDGGVVLGAEGDCDLSVPESASYQDSADDLREEQVLEMALQDLEALATSGFSGPLPFLGGSTTFLC